MEKHDAASAQTSWSGINYVVSSPAPGGTFNPRIPLISDLVDGTEDELEWDDISEGLRKRLKAWTVRKESVLRKTVQKTAPASIYMYPKPVISKN